MKLFGYNIHFENPEELLRIYIDVFIKSQYYFETSLETPNILDFGSHIGLPIFYFKMLYPNSKITAVEANPYTFQILKNNIEKNNLSDVQTVNSVVSNEISKKEFYFNRKNKTSWGSSIFKSQESDKIVISSNKASSFLPNDAVQLLKVDIEGSEQSVLEELSTSKKLKHISNLIIEFHELRKDENKLSSLLQILEKNRFKYTFDYFLRKRFISTPQYLFTKKYGDKYNFLIVAERNKN